MSFGKDPKQLENIPAFGGPNLRQQVAQQQYRPKPENNGGGGVLPAFIGAYYPSKDATDRIRLIRGAYQVESIDPNNDGATITQTLSYMVATSHESQRTHRTGFCSAGPFRRSKAKALPCRGCEVFWAEYNVHKRGVTMSMRELTIFNVFDYGEYAHVPQTNKAGVVRTDASGNAYMEWRKIYGRNDKNANAPERQMGMLRHWELGHRHLGQLLAYDADISKSCVNCGSADSITITAYLCPHCKDAVIDMSDTRLSDKEINAMTLRPAACPHCRNVGLLFPYVECANCPSPIQASLFDVDLKVSRKTGVDPKGKETSELVLLGFSKPAPMDERYGTITPKPLDRIYAPTPADKWDAVYGAAAPAAAARPSAGARPYNRPAAQPWGAQNAPAPPTPRTVDDDYPEDDSAFETDDIPFLG